jgi:hypothetical protein
MHRRTALWVVPMLILGAVLNSMRPGAPPLWAYPIITAALVVLAWALHLRNRRRERRLRGTPFISHASRPRL